MARETASESDGRESADTLSLEEGLSIIGEETRARIVIELGEAVADDDVTPRVLSFSELMERVGAADSGRFNYHLDKLVGTFVRKTDAGYALRPPGHFFYRAVVAGTLTDRDPLDPFVVGDCPSCGDALEAVDRQRHYLSVRCRSCESFTYAAKVPERALAGRSPESALDAAIRAKRHRVELLREGVCHACHGQVSRDLRREIPVGCDRFCEFEAFAVLSCTACNVRGVDHPARVALATPPAVGFFADDGRDAHAVPPWATPVAGATERTQVVATDPLAVAVDYELGAERLRIVLDDSLQVTETTRSTV